MQTLIHFCVCSFPSYFHRSRLPPGSRGCHDIKQSSKSRGGTDLSLVWSGEPGMMSTGLYQQIAGKKRHDWGSLTFPSPRPAAPARGAVKASAHPGGKVRNLLQGHSLFFHQAHSSPGETWKPARKKRVKCTSLHELQKCISLHQGFPQQKVNEQTQRDQRCLTTSYPPRSHQWPFVNGVFSPTMFGLSDCSIRLMIISWKKLLVSLVSFLSSVTTDQHKIDKCGQFSNKLKIKNNQPQ